MLDSPASEVAVRAMVLVVAPVATVTAGIVTPRDSFLKVLQKSVTPQDSFLKVLEIKIFWKSITIHASA
jgi:hypothetical protein